VDEDPEITLKKDAKDLKDDPDYSDNYDDNDDEIEVEFNEAEIYDDSRELRGESTTNIVCLVPQRVLGLPTLEKPPYKVSQVNLAPTHNNSNDSTYSTSFSSSLEHLPSPILQWGVRFWKKPKSLALPTLAYW